MIRWNVYKTSLSFRERIVGGIPIALIDGERNYSGWLKGQGLDEPNVAELAAKLAEDPDMPTTEEPVEVTITGFRRDQDNCAYIEARQVKAMLKEAAQRLGFVKRTKGTKQVLQHDLHVRAADGSQVIRLLPAPAQVQRESRPISVITPMGPRTSIKEFEYVEDPSIEFLIYVLAGGIGNGLLGIEQLNDMLALGQDLGIGADRSQGEGTFDVDSIEHEGVAEGAIGKEAVIA